MIQSVKKLFKATVPALAEYVGRRVYIQERGMLDGRMTVISGEWVDIEHICGNRFKQNFYEINGTHLISMLRFHAQMNGDTSITEEQFQAFDEMEMAAEKVRDPKPKQEPASLCLSQPNDPSPPSDSLPSQPEVH